VRRPGAAELQEWLRQPTAWLIFAVGALVSLFAWRSLVLEVENTALASFSKLALESANEIDSRLRAYRIMLVGLQGFFQANPGLDRRAFERYTDTLAREHGVSQLRSFSYARYVSGPMRRRFENTVRADRSVQPEGYPRFAIRPAGERDEYLVLLYLSPTRPNDRAFGLDVMADAVRRRAVERARDTGDLIASGPISLVSSESGERGVTLRLPVYRTQAALTSLDMRRETFDGMVNVVFSMREVVGDIVSRHERDGLELRIVDLGPVRSPPRPDPLYESPSAGNVEQRFQVKSELELGERRWQLAFSAPQSRFRSAGDAVMPWLTLLGGLVITVLLTGFTGSLAMSTRRAHRIANEITDDLRRSQAQLAEEQRRTAQLIETLPNPVFFKDREGRYLGANLAWEKFFGMARSEIVGRTVHDLYAHAPDIGRRLQEMDDELWAQPGTQSYEATIRLRDGSPRDTIYSKATLTGPDGRVAGLVGTILDITERKRAEKRQLLEHAATRVLAGSEKAEDAVARVMRIMCETMGWEGAAYWRWEVGARELRFATAWQADPAAAEAAKAGVAWTSFSRARPEWSAEPAGGAFAFPLLLGRDVLGVIGFFGVREAPDPIVAAMAHSIGSQIAQYIVRKQAEDALRFVATHDALTNLPNRVMFGQRLEHAIQQASRHERRLAVLFIDLDRFKVINDTLGHEFGDRLLREAAQRLVGAVRASDTVGRLGGDEFVVLLEEISDPLGIAAVAQKLIGAIAQGFVLAGKEYHVSASIGVSTYPDDARDAQELLKYADIAMYRAKEQGRNTFQFYAAQHNVHTVERLTLESGLRRALERGQLVLYYQPIVDVRGRVVTGVEALVRWQHPELGLLPPASFIGIAEETGLIVPIGQWVMHAACAAQLAWRNAGLPPLRMSVNLSPRQLLRAELIGDIESMLRTGGCGPGELGFEITESMVMQDPDRAVALLRDMRALGVRIAIDDFGIGHSSLAYLKRLPADQLKIDRSFVADIPDDAGSAAITQTIVALAHSLGMTVIAEGVETRAQLDFLAAKACDEFQGYLFSRPLPGAELRALLERQRSQAA